MAQAGVVLHLGREGGAEYGESLAGVRDRTPTPVPGRAISPHDARGRLLPEIIGRANGDADGAADRRCRPTTSACA